MFTETLREATNPPPPPPTLDRGALMATSEEGSGRQGWMWGKLGAESHVPRRGLCLHRHSPHTLSDRTSCVFAMSIFSQNWKERKLGGQATSSSSRCQHPHHVEVGNRRNPKSPFLRKAGQCSLPPARRSAEPDGCDEGTSFGLAAESGVLPPFPA